MNIFVVRKKITMAPDFLLLNYSQIIFTSPNHYFNNKVANQLKQSIYFPGDFVTLDCRILANGLRLSLSVSFWILLDRAVRTWRQGVRWAPKFWQIKVGQILPQKFVSPQIFRPSYGPGFYLNNDRSQAMKLFHSFLTMCRGATCYTYVLVSQL